MSNAFKIPKNKLLFLRQKTVFGVFCFLVLLNVFTASAFANTSASATASVIPTPSGGGGLFSPPLTEAKRTDANKDNRVDFLDFNILMANWGAVGSNIADFNGDGVIDLFDFNLLMIYWTG